MIDQVSDEFNLFDNEDLLFYNDGTKNKTVNLSKNSLAFSETYYGTLNMENLKQKININNEEYFSSSINNAMYDNNKSVSKSLNAQLYFNDHVISPSSSYRFLKRGPTTKVCEFCGLFLQYPSKIAAHMRTHTGERPFVCEYCGQDFSQRTPYRMHVKRHIGDLPFNCSFCDKKFPNNASRNGHEFRVHHKLKKLENSQSNLMTTQSLINKSGVDITKKCSSFINLQSSVENFKKPLTDIAMRRISNIVEFVAAGIHENIIIPSSTTKVHESLSSNRRCENRHPPTIAQCADCGLIFKHPSKIQAHMRTHTGEKPFRCTECGLCCSTNSALRVHIRRFHTGERPHECTWECGKRFVSVSARNEHERIVHAGIKRYQCAIGECRRLFTRRSYMVKHLQTHSSSVVELLHQKHPITSSFKRLQNEKNILELEI